MQSAAAILATVLLGGCAASAVSDVEERAGAEPRPYLMQYAAVYFGSADNRAFDWLELRRDGSFAAVIDGVRREGHYVESDAASSHPALTFSVDGESFVGTLRPEWTSGHQLSLSRAGAAESLVTTSVGGETLCEESGGLWRDDDVDGSGLYCTCPGAMKYIPSAGGCTD